MPETSESKSSCMGVFILLGALWLMICGGMAIPTERHFVDVTLDALILLGTGAAGFMAVAGGLGAIPGLRKIAPSLGLLTFLGLLVGGTIHYASIIDQVYNYDAPLDQWNTYVYLLDEWYEWFVYWPLYGLVVGVVLIMILPAKKKDEAELAKEAQAAKEQEAQRFAPAPANLPAPSEDSTAPHSSTTSRGEDRTLRRKPEGDDKEGGNPLRIFDRP